MAYHFVEGAARDEPRTSYVNTHENEAHLLTKQLPHHITQDLFSSPKLIGIDWGHSKYDGSVIELYDGN